MQKQILNEENAIKEVLQILRDKLNYQWNNIHPLNKNRYCVVTGEPTVAILLKREPFYTFGKKFRDQGASGVGDTINTKHLKEFVQWGVEMIYTLFPDGKLYSIPLQEFLLNSYSWVQKEGTSVRSISIHEYRRVN